MGPAVLQDLSVPTMLSVGTTARGLSFRYLGFRVKLYAGGYTHEEPSRLITWAVMLPDISTEPLLLFLLSK